MSRQKILGDYQTPLPLATQIISQLFSDNPQWKRILEPTCGIGNFIQACIDVDVPAKQIIGLDIQQEYVQRAQTKTSSKSHISIFHQDIFAVDLSEYLNWQSNAPLLIVGNPPWVTNSELGRLGGDNLPTKHNSQKLSGLDALTGKSNFDIAESIWLKLIHEYQNDVVTIALLCKTSVTRKVAQSIFDSHYPVNHMALYHIDAKHWFDVAVDAGLFIVELNQGKPSYHVDVYDSLEADTPRQTIGFVNQRMVADIQSYQGVQFVDNICAFEWRQGVKHDASKVMELTHQDGTFINGYGEQVKIESNYLYPLIKSSDVKSIDADFTPRKYVIITQTQLGQNTTHLQQSAPKLWDYLQSHTDKLDARKSSIYKNAPQFSIFGIGDYSFAPYKIVVSGFYLPAQFALVSTHGNQPYLTDDTCYFLSFDEQWKALVVIALLEHGVVKTFIESIVFPDSKRPITKSLLSRVDLKAVYQAISRQEMEDLIQKIGHQYHMVANIPTDTRQVDQLFGRQLQLL